MKLPSSLTPSRNPAKKVRTVFLSKKMLPVAFDEPVNVVVSPAFYWFRDVVLPAKSAAQARKLAPSYFDAVIPAGEYEYLAIAKTQSFWLFAYDPDLIAEALHDAGLKPSQVQAVYFAQTECVELPGAFRINETAALVANEGTVSVIASRYADAQEAVEAYLDRTPRSRHKINISLFRSGLLDEKQLGRATIVAIVLLALYVGYFLQLRHQYKQQLIREAALKEHYKLPETSFELKSMMNSLEGKAHRQLELRSMLRQILQIPLQEGEAVTSLAITEKKADIEIRLLEPQHAESIKASLQKGAKVASARVKDNIFYVSITHE